MSKNLVYVHTTGKRLVQSEIDELDNELTGNDLKEAINNGFKNHGYFTKEEGKGKKVSAICAGKGTYYNKEKLTDSEVIELEKLNFVRLAKPRMSKLVKSIRAMVNVANDNLYTWSDEQTEDIIGCLQAEMAQLENKLRVVKEDKVEKTGYSFKFSE